LLNDKGYHSNKEDEIEADSSALCDSFWCWCRGRWGRSFRDVRCGCFIDTLSSAERAGVTAGCEPLVMMVSICQYLHAGEI
jgi:hypothetical protein